MSAPVDSERAGRAIKVGIIGVGEVGGPEGRNREVGGV